MTLLAAHPSVRGLLALVPLIAACAPQRPDASYTPTIERPAYTAAGPVVCFDEGHDNSHRSNGLYKPFVELLERDGYAVRPVQTRFTTGVPDDCRTLVIVNAAGGRTYKVFGLNLPTEGHKHRDRSAFMPAEIATLRTWVERGGSLLLIADHYPYGAAATPLARGFDVDMSGGFTEAANVDTGAGHDRSQLAYSRENGLLGEHAITRGRDSTERVRRVVTFTGQSLSATSATPLLVLGDSAIDYVPPPPRFQGRAATGRSQGVALERGRGRIVVLAEAAMLTAQVDAKSGRKFGMQRAGTDNQQFALNVMHWLSRLL